jgi:hypothetical protein
MKFEWSIRGPFYLNLTGATSKDHEYWNFAYQSFESIDIWWADPDKNFYADGFWKYKVPLSLYPSVEEAKADVKRIVEEMLLDRLDSFGVVR